MPKWSKLARIAASLAADQARLKAELDVLDQSEAALTGYASGTRLILQAARQNQLQGARGALNAFIDVPSELEKAISSALGDFLDAVLLDDEPDASMDLLFTQSGRGVLLPLKDIKPNPIRIHPFEPNEAILGEAADLIKIHPELQSVVELLLRGVIIVRDRKAARRLLADQPAGVRVVTLQGDVFFATGPIQSGFTDTGAKQSLLGRSRQRRELHQKSERILDQTKDADQLLGDLKEEMASLQLEGTRLEQSREHARQEVMKSGRLLDQAKNALDQAVRQGRWNQDQLQRLKLDQERRKSELQKVTTELAGLDTKILTARSALREQNTALENLTLDDFQAEQSHWVTRQAVAERALSDARARLAERRQTFDRLIQSQITLQDHLHELERLQNELEEKRKSATQSEGEVGAFIRDLNAMIEPTESELAQLEQKQEADQNASNAMRQQVSMAEHLHAQTRINLARRQETLQSLQRRIEDDFGLVAYEYVAQVSGPTPLPLTGMVEQLPMVSRLSPDIEENIKRQRLQLRRMGPVNPEAQAEYLEVRQRYEFLTEQVADLKKAEEDVHQVISELDELMQREFRKTFDAVAIEFRQIFIRLFGGGSARLVLTDPDDLTSTGIEIEARLPGRRSQGLALLSGGERSLTATSLVFALLKVSPTPFCVLDEVDAMLDEANVGRFRDLLRELSRQTQFLIVTHNRNTVQVADVIYGITMGKNSSSQILSLKLDEIEQVLE